MPVMFCGLCRSRQLSRLRRAVRTSIWRPYSITSEADKEKPSASKKLKDGPPLEYFLANSATPTADVSTEEPSVTYLDSGELHASGKKVYFETYGCQMNVNDTEIATAILEKHGYEKTNEIMESDAVFIMTCSIREGAEQKIWRRLDGLRKLNTHIRTKRKHRKAFKIGILGCMAENLKKKILEKEKAVDIVCGPDAYRDLPHMLAATTDTGQASVNVQLSLEETYADVMPVRADSASKSAFVSIMRGCDNMCSYCIVPFTRGRERSRPIDSIVQEVQALSDQGIKEVTLLGQNVNSYRDLSQSTVYSVPTEKTTHLVEGFRTVYKPKVGGRRFSDLLDKVSMVDPEMRIRFTSPHPKDFPDEVLHLIKDRVNICKQLHMPAQSGSTRVLEAMRRGYSREAYIDLIQHVRQILPDVSLSSDFIAGFCGETDEDHEQTLSLMSLIKYNYAYCFPYSMRGKTHAFHRLEDNVPADVKQQRHHELAASYRQHALDLHQGQVGQVQLVLVIGDSKRSSLDLAAKNDGNTKVIFPKSHLPGVRTSEDPRPPRPGDYVAVKITGCSSLVLKGTALYRTTLAEFSSNTTKYQTCVA